MAGETDEAVIARTEIGVEQRSAVRQWAPVVSMTLLGLLSYVDRSVLAILSPTILAALHLSATQYGYAILVFSLCYMLANPVWGFWMDRAGLWITTLVAVLVWSLASGSHGLMTGFVGMCVGACGAGIRRGCDLSCGAEDGNRDRCRQRSDLSGLGIAYSGSSLGAALTPLLITPIAIRWGWRAAFGVTAVLGLAWILLWLFLRISGWFVESEDVAEASQEAVSALPETSRWNRNLFAAACAYGLGAAPLAFGLYAAPLYLTRVLHLSQASLGHLLWLATGRLGGGVSLLRAPGRSATTTRWRFRRDSTPGLDLCCCSVSRGF